MTMLLTQCKLIWFQRTSLIGYTEVRGVALRPSIIISGVGSGVRRIFDREIRLFYQQANGRRHLMQL